MGQAYNFYWDCSSLNDHPLVSASVNMYVSDTGEARHRKVPDKDSK